MSVRGKSRISLAFFVLSSSFALQLPGQQKANDFTKRLGNFDGKMSSLSGRSSKMNRLSPSSALRITVDEWPAHFSPFGGKRFPMGSAKILGKERITSSNIEVKTPLNDRIAGENFERVNNQNLLKRDQAVHSVEFRDAYYAQLNDRVDEWMDKVNNMSLRDINRYQFRRDRPKEPGFPVQRAGAAGIEGSHRESSIRDSGLPLSKQKSQSLGNRSYWLGPKKINTTRSSSFPSSSATGSDISAPSSNSTPPPKNFKASPKPILGPKTIRVQVNNAK